MIFFIVFLLVAVALSAGGLLTDSRDSADWQPSSGGLRRPPGR